MQPSTIFCLALVTLILLLLRHHCRPTTLIIKRKRARKQCECVEVTTEQEVEEVLSQSGGVILIYASWCPVCPSYLHLYRELCQEFPSVDFYLIDVGSLTELPHTLGIDVVPTLLFSDGTKAPKSVPVMDPETFRETIRKKLT